MTGDAVFVHPQGLCESEEVGPGTKVWAFAHVMDGALVGADCNVCGGVFVETGAVVGSRVTLKNNVSVWDKVVIEDDVFVGPSVAFTNDLRPRSAFKNPPSSFLPTIVKRHATIGANATLVCGIEVGTAAFVAAGAVVVRDVPPHALVAGNPARVVGWVCLCGARLDERLKCDTCGRRHAQDGDGLRALHDD